MASSQYDDLYETATGTSFKDIMHSTPQTGHPARQQMPLDYDQYPDPAEHDSDGSGEMSIETGRGGKRAHNYNDISSEGIFSFGNDHSQYEITATPPVRPRNSQRKSDSVLRKEASIRRATDSVRTKEPIRSTANGAKPRAVSDNLPRRGTEEDSHDPTLPTVTFAVRGSRFTTSRHVSRSYSGIPARFTSNEGLIPNSQTPQRAANATVQSATYTANQSFMIPDMSHIHEIISGEREIDTPLPNRIEVPRPSRFQFNARKPSGQQYLPIHSIPLPEEEKAIFASLQQAHDRIAQLELERSEHLKRAEELESTLAELRSQLNMATRRSDSALGSDDESAGPKSWQNERKALQARCKALQSPLDKTERKATVSDITVTRIIRERDALVAQIGSSRYANEELEKENERLKLDLEQLRAANQELREELATQAESQARDAKATQSNRSQSKDRAPETLTTKAPKIKRARRSAENEARPAEQIDQAAARDLSARIEEEVQKHRDNAASKAQVAQQSSQSNTLQGRSRSRSRSQPRRASIQAPVTNGSTTLPADDHVEEDMTVLSELDMDAVAHLRRKLEAERQRRHQRRSAGPEDRDVEAEAEAEVTVASTRAAVPRKSSLKDVTGGFAESTGRFSIHGATLDDLTKIAKTVRVQSPHSSQDILEMEQVDTEIGDTSVLSNTSRRRRRASSVEGMTSAFILPDITMAAAQIMTSDNGSGCIEHKTASCTVCALGRKEEVTIPVPIPVTDREDVGDVTNATIRPAQSPMDALATVIKNLEDEIKHLKILREKHNRAYTQHDPAHSKRRRQDLKRNIDRLTASIEQRSDQVYRLYDVLEGLKQQGKTMEEHEVEETLNSIGVDPVELSGRVGRSAPAGLEDIEGLSGEESDELPWEGLSDVESEE